jgi:MFS transporter, ACS family, aldohexuronate transporter
MSPLRRNLLLALLIAGNIINYADRQIIAILKPLLQHRLHWSDSDYGTLTATFQFSAAFAYLGAGWIVDRVGWRRANPLAVGTWSLAEMAHALTRTLGQFLAARVALGATESLGTPNAIKTVAVLFGARARAVAIGATNAAGNMGAIITPFVVPAIALTLGWQAAFAVTGAVGLVWVAAWLAVLKGEETASDQPAGQPSSAAGTVTWRAVLSDRTTWAIAGAKSFSDQVWWFLLFWTPDFFHREFHLNMQGFAAPVAVIYAVSAVGALAGGELSSRLIARGMGVVKARQFTLLLCALLVTPVPIVLHVSGAWVAVGLLSLTLAAHQGFSVNLFALATDVTPTSRVGTVISIAALCGNLAGTLLLKTTGWVLGNGYGYGPLFALVAVSYLLAFGWLRLLLPRASAATPAELRHGW